MVLNASDSDRRCKGGRDRGSGHGNAGAHGAFGVSVRRRVAVVVAEIESGVADEKKECLAKSAF